VNKKAQMPQNMSGKIFLTIQQNIENFNENSADFSTVYKLL
jgi:hypothetical protein